jgi:hypothetical protein
VQEASKFDERQEGLEGLGQIGTGLCLATGQFADAGAIGQHWPNIARETATLAGKYEPVANVVDKLIMIGPFAALLSAVLPFALQLAVNHGRIGDAAILGGFGVMPKEALEAQGRATAMRMVQAAMEEQMKAQRELQEAEASLAAMQSRNGAQPQSEPAVA